MKIHLPLVLLCSLATLPLSAQKAAGDGKAKASANNPVDAHFVKARALFDQKKIGESAEHIYKATDLIHKRLITADELPTKGIVNTANKLESLAEKVDNNKIKDGKTLDRTFASASKNLASYYTQVAETAHKKGNKKDAAAAMTRSAFYLENTAKWSGKKLNAEEQDSILGLRNAGNALVEAGDKVVKIPASLFTGAAELLAKLGGEEAIPVKSKPKKTK
ncbi:MAG: hypothetical protein ACSHYF_13235 [Verrucomicrobiaceae bacterium]